MKILNSKFRFKKLKVNSSNDLIDQLNKFFDNANYAFIDLREITLDNYLLIYKEKDSSI